ncbi:hypothetical protein GGI07_004160 [Coemansia sp. Benny D115]|nr:hypothetical protein GGI07_004160 [Coemansia sp. Benny D115]
MGRVVRQQAHLRLKMFVFIVIVASISIVGVYMFASYTDSMAQNRNYLTLGFNHIFVLSPKGAEQERKVMVQQLRYQGIMPFGFFPALNFHDIDHPEDHEYWLGEEHWAPPPTSNRTLAADALADFRTHMNVINDVMRLQFGSALVLDDRVDLDLEIKQKMREMLEHIPDSWDILYLGHCGTPETKRPSGMHQSLFVGYQPGCSFAYAVSRQGAKRLKRILDNIWPYPERDFASQLIELVRPKYLEAYVIEPPLVASIRAGNRLGTAQISGVLQKSTLSKLGLLRV